MVFLATKNWAMSIDKPILSVKRENIVVWMIEDKD